MKPWILCIREMPNYEDVIDSKIVFYDLKNRDVYIDEIPRFRTNSEICYEHFGWMKKEDFLENCREFTLTK